MRGRVSAPANSWPSPVHEQAMFEATLLPGERRSWGLWPDINHESACYNIMCNHVCIHPEVAREKGLGLVVKVSDPPCIGLVNGVVYDKIRGIEQCKRRHDFFAAEVLKQDSGMCPQDWLTITLNPPWETQLHLTLEATMSNALPGGTGYDCILGPLTIFDKDAAPMYTVRGVWYDCLGDDPCIGAELTWSYEDDVDYGAILI